MCGFLSMLFCVDPEASFAGGVKLQAGMSSIVKLCSLLTRHLHICFDSYVMDCSSSKISKNKS